MPIQAFTKTGCTFRLKNPRILTVLAGTIRDDVNGSTITVPETDIDVNTVGAAGLDTGTLAAGDYAVYAQGPTSVTCVFSLEKVGAPTLVDSHTTYGFLGFVKVVSAAGGILQFSGDFDDSVSAVGEPTFVSRAAARMWAWLAATVGAVGALVADTISEYTAAAGVTIDGVLVKDGDVTLGQNPSSALHAATKQYVDALVNGLDVKASVRAVSTSNITLSGAQTIDGVSIIAGDRVLVAGQSTGAQNGIYVAAASAWSRATDADSSAEVTSGMYTHVSEGTTYADTNWVCTTNDAITLGTTALVFSQFGGTDAGAVHKSTAAEISALSGATPADADVVLGEDASAGTAFSKVKFTLLQIATYVLGYVHSLTAKATPVAADEVLLQDSESSFASKSATLTSLAATIFGLAPSIEAKTSSYPVVSADRFKTFTNEGAGAIVPFTLPAAAAGEGPFTWVVQDADGIRVTADSGDTIRLSTAVSAAAGKIESTEIGATVTLRAINATEWVSISGLGTWTAT